uniref:CARD domain-containing protein n=1 Tax=Gadus morhua TaxID=8049 RepID=A0A8C5FFQ9_GADMO
MVTTTNIFCLCLCLCVCVCVCVLGYSWKARGPMRFRLQVWCLKCRSRLWSATRSCPGSNSLRTSRTPGDLLDRFMMLLWSTRIHLCSSLSISPTLCALLAIEEQVLISRKNGIKITETFKHLTCRLEEKLYCLESEPEGEIDPPTLEFTTAVLALKGLFVARFRNLPPFKLFLWKKDCDQPFLNVTIREDDWPSEERPGLWNSFLRLFRPFVYNTAVQATSSPPATSSATRPVAEELLRNSRLEFVNRASDPLIKGLLDDLLQHEVLNSAEKDFVKDQSGRADRAGELIDMVVNKGPEASQKMIDSMKVRDRYLSSTLGLISSPTG